MEGEMFESLSSGRERGRHNRTDRHDRSKARTTKAANRIMKMQSE